MMAMLSLLIQVDVSSNQVNFDKWYLACLFDVQANNKTLSVKVSPKLDHEEEDPLPYTSGLEV